MTAGIEAGIKAGIDAELIPLVSIRAHDTPSSTAQT